MKRRQRTGCEPARFMKAKRKLNPGQVHRHYIIEVGCETGTSQARAWVNRIGLQLLRRSAGREVGRSGEGGGEGPTLVELLLSLESPPPPAEANAKATTAAGEFFPDCQSGLSTYSTIPPQTGIGHLHPTAVVPLADPLNTVV